MNVKDKISRIVARNPELKETLLSLEDDKIRKIFNKIVESKTDKIVIVGKKSEEYARLYELASIINNGYIHITSVTTVDLLDAYVDRDLGTDEDTPSLSTVVDNLVIIKDSRAFIPNKQKTNMIMQVFEQNTRCIYYYKGSPKSFANEHPSLTEYARDSSIKILQLKEQVNEV